MEPKNYFVFFWDLQGAHLQLLSQKPRLIPYWQLNWAICLEPQAYAPATPPKVEDLIDQQLPLVAKIKVPGVTSGLAEPTGLNVW